MNHHREAWYGPRALLQLPLARGSRNQRSLRRRIGPSGMVLRLLLPLVVVLSASPALAHHVNRYEDYEGPFRPRSLPLAVWISPDLPFAVADAIAPWNALVPGLEVFTVAPTWKEADVRARPGRWSGAGCHWNYHSGDFRRCYITLQPDHVAAPYGLGVLQHELGHTLGYADHASPEFYVAGFGRRVCGDPDHPRYHPYMGIMTYCTLTFVGADARMVERKYGHLVAAV